MNRTAQAGGLRTIGKYELISKIAEGGMGLVYKATHLVTGATVAIKVGSIALAKDKVLLKRFEQEYRSTSNLCHPNIVRGLEFGWEGTRPYIVMEFVDGEDMWARLDRVKRLPEAEAVRYIVQVAHGLHEAHKNGIIHRDIKPDNILLSNDGQAKLADLGLSKDLESDMELTCDHRGLGTPNFIAPEQFGDAKHSGVRCDVYGLGATLYMAVTGQMPFAGSDLSAILAQKLADNVTPPRKLAPTLSERVDWAVRRAILADPNRRHGSCPEFIAALTGEDQDGRTSGQHRVSGRRPAVKPVQNQSERRAAVRYSCTLPTSCTINMSLHEDAAEFVSQWTADVVDLSLTGIGLVLSRRFEPKSIFKVVLASPKGDFERTREIQVVRVAPADGMRWFIAGTLKKRLSKEELRQLL